MIDSQFAYFLALQQRRVRRVLDLMEKRIRSRQEGLMLEQFSVDERGRFSEVLIKGAPTGEAVYTHAAGPRRDPLDRERGE